MIQTMVMIGIPLLLIFYLQRKLVPKYYFLLLGFLFGIIYAIRFVLFPLILVVGIRQGIVLLIWEIVLVVAIETAIRHFIIKRFYVENIYHFLMIVVGYVSIKLIAVAIVVMFDNIYSLTLLSLPEKVAALSGLEHQLLVQKLAFFTHEPSWQFIGLALYHLTFFVLIGSFYILHRQRVFSPNVLIVLHLFIYGIATGLLHFYQPAWAYIFVLVILMGSLSIVQKSIRIIFNSE